MNAWKRLGPKLKDRRLNLALRRWAAGGQRRNDEVRLIDYWVALEALFLPDSTAELSFRASLRIAAFVGETGQERQQLYKEMRASYDVRSKVVHGDTPRTPVSVVAAQTGSTVRRALLKIIESDDRFDATRLEATLLGH